MASTLYWILLYSSTAIISALAIAYVYFLYLTNYFKRRNIPFVPARFPFGYLTSMFALEKSYSMLLVDLYNNYKGERFVGFYQFWKKSILVIDRELIRLVLVKDYEHFNHKSIHHNRDLEPLSANLFALDGHEWKVLRAKLSPAYTSGRLKNMFDTVLRGAENLGEFVSSLASGSDGVLEAKDIFVRYGLAQIASTAFGLDSDVLTDKTSMFFRMAEGITAPTLGAMFRNGLLIYGRDFAKAFNLRVIPKDSHSFFYNLVKDTVEYRETHGEVRRDFLQQLMELKEGSKFDNEEVRLTLQEIAAQSYVFILGAFETTSNAMSFFLYEMALNPEIQKRLQEEVDSVEEITYDSLATMEYLEMALDETLRKYPPLGFVARVCSQDFTVPDTDQVIEKGTEVLVSSHALHHDPDLFPDPEQFIPERFSKENKNNIKPFSFLPFGDGPRFCIGQRFGKVVIKAGLAVLMRRFEVRVDKKTPIPAKITAKTINTSVEGGMWLKFIKRERA